jgi:guanylate kinase
MENHLSHLDEFTAILSNYQVSPRAQKSLETIKLVLLVAPSAGGRNTLINKLLTTGNYNFIVSDTTRNPRINNGVLEQNGHEYWFRTEEEVLDDLKNGEFLEAEVIHSQQVSGISIRELERAAGENKISVTDVDIGGIKKIVGAKPDVVAILVLPPSFEEWQRRLNSRGQLQGDEYSRRMQTAVNILTDAQTNKDLIIIISDVLEHSVKQVNDILNGQIDLDTQKKGHELIENLLIKIKNTLLK